MTTAHTMTPTLVSRIAADRLSGAPWMTGLSVPSREKLMLDEALAKLAEAEEKLNEQQDRIAYLESLTMTDELTGLLNRRGFNGQFRRALASARRQGAQGAQGGMLVMIDLDGFKAINDTHGHLAGDAYLRHVARLLAAKVRDHDVVARLGGDEFAILLTGTDAETASARAQELSQAADADAMTWDGVRLPIRFSVGTQAYTADDHEDEVMRQADQRMYAHKSARRRGR
jgi:diguanylate cyclase (GGDEF)-like protein